MKILVTGAGGFLGRYITRRLIDEGHIVHTLQRGFYPQLEAWGCRNFRGDMTRMLDITAAMSGCEAVFHVAARPGMFGPYAAYAEINKIGTERVLAAALRCKVKYLIFTSSPSVVFNGTSQHALDERAPYADHYLAAYPQTKAEAEQLVLAANGAQLRTIALRPHLIWGPGDRYLVPRIVQAAKKGKLRLVGDGSNLVDAVYVENAAFAHIKALEKMMVNPAVCGRPFFITNGEPWPLAKIINEILAAYDLPPVSRTISPTLAYGLGAIMEMTYRVIKFKNEPPLSRFIVRQLASPHYFDVSRAREELGYEPYINMQEGLALLKRGRDQWLMLSEKNGRPLR